MSTDKEREHGAYSVKEKASKIIRLTIPWTPPTTLGQNAHKHWRHKHPDEQSAHMIGWTTANASRYGAQDVPELPVLVAVIHWEKKSRRKDADNALGTIKQLVDGICKGIGIDDRRFVTSMAFQKVDPKRRGFTEIIIRAANADERRLGT